MAKLKVNVKGLKAFEKMAKRVIELEKRVKELEAKVADGTTTYVDEIEAQLPSYVTENQRLQIINAVENKKPIIIGGIQGPTGKTFLKKTLKKNGLVVFEEWEIERVFLDIPIDRQSL